MSDPTHTLTCSEQDAPSVIEHIAARLQQDGYRSQVIELDDGRRVLQAERTAKWRRVTGMATALNTTFAFANGELSAEFSRGRWYDKAAAGAISWFLFAPFALTAGWGAWEQYKLPEKIMKLGQDGLHALRLEELRRALPGIGTEDSAEPQGRSESLRDIIEACDHFLDLEDFEAEFPNRALQARAIRAMAMHAQGQENESEDQMLRLVELLATGTLDLEHDAQARDTLAQTQERLAGIFAARHRPDNALVLMQGAERIASPDMRRRLRSARHAMRERMAALLRDQRPEDRRILVCTSRSPAGLANEFIVADEDTLRETGWRFEVGHPANETSYACHPLRPDTYYPLRRYHARLFEDKQQELVHVLESIGARRIRLLAMRSLGSRQSQAASSGASGGIGDVFGSTSSHVQAQSSSSAEQRSSQLVILNSTLSPASAPALPDDLHWYPHEPTWQRVATSALSGRYDTVELELRYQEDYTVNTRRSKRIDGELASLFGGQLSSGWNAEAEQTLEETMTTIWQFSIDFGDAART